MFSSKVPSVPIAASLAAHTAGGQVTRAPAAPVAERRPYTDILHGETRQDDYFWLRVKTDPAVRDYLEAENSYAETVLAPLAPLRQQLYTELLGRIKQTDLSVPYRHHGYYYYSRTVEGLQYPVHARKHGSLEASEQVLLDLNELARGHSFMALGSMEVSDDGRLVAHTLDSTGFRQYSLRILDADQGTLLESHAERVTSVAWAADGRTLFYSVEHPVTKRSYQLYRHTVGEQEHTLVHEEPDERFSVYVRRTRSGRFLLMEIGSLTTSETRFVRADDPRGSWAQIEPRVADRQYFVDHHGDRFYIRVNDAGRNFRLVSTPVAAPSSPNWEEVIGHRPETMLTGVHLFAGHLVTTERRDGIPRVAVRDLATGSAHEIEFPEQVYTAGLGTNAEFDTHVLRVTYQSMVTPSSIFDYDMTARTRTLLKEQEVLGGYDRTLYTTERLYATAPDGVRIPVSVVYRNDRGVRSGGPLLLVGYGSYGVSSNATFSSNRLSLLDRGVAVAIAHIRGGGDLGKGWHDDGRMMNKMNTFTDFIAVAEHLIAIDYTSAEKLVVEGGSAGGLLMGVVTNMRPELFRAVVSHVPFVDVINTMLDETLPLTVGEFEEWGNPKEPEDYAYMRRYDPYSNLRTAAYPSILIRTAFNDSQVMYHEPAKYTARLRTLKTDANPLLFVTNMGAGHGGASGRYDRLAEIALDYAFVLWQVGLDSPPSP
jgi:oligopeptidase B